TGAASTCPQVSDQMTIVINPAATVNAGADQIVCASSPQVQLAGAVGGGATAGLWSGGGGSYSPGSAALNAGYTRPAAGTAAGRATRPLPTNAPAGPCPAVSGQMRITIRPAAVVDAGPDQVVCSSAPRVQLQGFVSGGATGGTWSGGTGTYSPGSTA